MEPHQGGKVLSFAAHKRWLKHYMHKQMRKHPCVCNIFLAVADFTVSRPNTQQVLESQTVPSAAESSKEMKTSSLGDYKRKQKSVERKNKRKTFLSNVCACHFSPVKLSIYIVVTIFFLSCTVFGLLWSHKVTSFVYVTGAIGFFTLICIAYMLVKAGVDRSPHKSDCFLFSPAVKTPPSPPPLKSA